MVAVRNICIAVALGLASIASGATICVRKDGTGDYTSIQPALNTAADGDTVLIGPGEYTEWTMERLPGYSWDVKVFGRVKCLDLTLIGSGADVTVIGPPTYEGSLGSLSPKCITYDLQRGDLYVSDLTVQNCYDGVFVSGTLHLSRCRVFDCGLGLAWGETGSGGTITNSRIDATGAVLDAMAFDIGGGDSRDLVIEDSRWADGAVLRGISNVVIRNCEMGGLGLYSSTVAYIFSCRTLEANSGIRHVLSSGGYCEVRDSVLKGQYAALTINESAPGSRFVVENTRLEGGDHGILYSGNQAGACTIRNCDLVKGTGPMVECAPSAATITHDLSGNYWGTTVEAYIQSWIIDNQDNTNIGATVLYSPFAGQSVPAEATTWGDLKAFFR